MALHSTDEEHGSDSESAVGKKRKILIPDQKMFSKASLSLMEFLGRTYPKKYHVRELSRYLNYNVSTISITLKSLEKSGLVTHEELGNLVLYQAMMDNVLLRQIKIFFNILELNRLIQELKGIVTKLILYGSCARGEDTYESDVDLYIEVVDKERVKSVINRYREQITRELSPIINTPDETFQLQEKDVLLYDNIQRGIDLL